MSPYCKGYKTTTKDNLQQSQIHLFTVIKQAFKIKSAFIANIKLGLLKQLG